MDQVDRFSNLPESLICKILSELPTKEVVKTSVMSTKWRNLWKYVPSLNLGHDEFPNYNAFVSFVDRFLGFNTEGYLETFRLKYKCHECDDPEIVRWINAAVKRKVEYISVFEDSFGNDDFQIPSSVYTCERLLCLILAGVILAKPRNLVSLPCLRVMDLSMVTFDNDLAFEALISGSPVLERLIIRRRPCDNVNVLRVCSQSLESFTHVSHFGFGLDFLKEDLVVMIDAPKLEYMKLSDHRTSSFVIKNPDSLFEVDIDVVFNLGFGKKFNPNDLSKRNMIRDFLRSISGVENMVISSKTLKVIHDYSECEPLPLFHNLSFLRVEFCNYRWDMLPIFLKSCPNLKTLVVGSTQYVENDGITILHGPKVSLPSLEHVYIERSYKGDKMEMKLLSYLLRNSSILKLLAICLDDSLKKKECAIHRTLHSITRLSKSCKIVTSDPVTFSEVLHECLYL